MPEAHDLSPRTRLLVFDLDGTLIDSRRDLANSVNATLTHLSRETLPEEQIATFIGDGASALVERSLLAAGGCDPDVLGRAMPFFLSWYRKHNLDYTYAYDGVLPALAAIQKSMPQTRMAVLTNKPVRPSRVICDALGLSQSFFEIYGGDSFSTKKPDPEGLFRLMADATSGSDAAPVKAAETVVIGDSDVDVRTARAAGASVVGCRYGFAPEALIAARPDALVSKPEEWLAALNSLEGSHPVQASIGL